MEYKQLDIFTVHERENTPSSQAHLDANRVHFGKQCRRVFELLMKGERLTVYSALVDHKIASLPRRVLDLKNNGVRITDAWDGNTKVWYMTGLDRAENRRFENA